jgi:hypothetical protein
VSSDTIDRRIPICNKAPAMAISTSPSSPLDYYKSPDTVDPHSWTDAVTSKAHFPVEADRVYEIEVAFNHWNGREEYRVDGVLLRTTTNWWPWVRERFLLSSTPRTVLEFRCLFFPILPVRAYVNGRLHVGSIFPRVFRNLAIVSFSIGAALGTAVTFSNWLRS